MNFMFVECRDVDDAAEFFDRQILEDYFLRKAVSLEDALKVYLEFGSRRIGKNQWAAILLGVNMHNERYGSGTPLEQMRTAKPISGV